MPSTTTSKTSSKFRALAMQRAIDAVDAAMLGEECVDQLRSMLRAIVILSSHDPVIHGLAKVAFNLADSHHNLLDCSREDTAQNLRALEELGVDDGGAA